MWADNLPLALILGVVCLTRSARLSSEKCGKESDEGGKETSQFSFIADDAEMRKCKQQVTVNQADHEQSTQHKEDRHPNESHGIPPKRSLAGCMPTSASLRMRAFLRSLAPACEK